MNNQELFNRVAIHLIKQGRRSICTKDENICAYRGANGLKCAGGALIHDEHYHYDLENKVVNQPSVRAALFKSGISEDQLNLVIRLQSIHDNTRSQYWMRELTASADNYNLSIKALLKVYPNIESMG